MLYGLIPGMVTNAALLINLFYTLEHLPHSALYSPYRNAGMVLALGMAVDANVLINERIRRTCFGKNTRRALEDGYKNAFSAIIDSNLTTITGIILPFLEPVQSKVLPLH